MPRLPTIPFLAAALIAAAVPPAKAAEYCVSCSGPDASYRCEIGGSATDARAWLQCITELAKSGGHDSCSVDRNAPSPCPGIHKVLTPPEGAAPVPPPVQMTTPEPVPAPQVPPGQQQAAPGQALPNQPAPAVHPTPAATDQAAPTEQAAADPNAPIPPEGEPPTPAPKRVPKTMEELAGDAYQSSKDGLKNAGTSVTEGAKKAGTAVTDTAKAAGEGIGKAGSAVGNAAKKTWDCVTSLFQSC